MQIKIVTRLGIILSLFASLFCLSAIILGVSIPTSRIIAQIYSLTSRSPKLMLIDVDRTLTHSITVPYPTSGAFSFSVDGKRVILPNTDTFAIWDIQAGSKVNLADHFPDCLAINWTWLNDNRHIWFQCRTSRTNPAIGGMYMIDFETEIVYPLYPKPTAIAPQQWSPDTQMLAVNNLEGELFLVGRYGDNLTQISPTGRRLWFVAWMPDGESLLVTGMNTLERYWLSSQIWEVVTTVPAPNYRPTLSPDGDWLAFYTTLDTADGLHPYTTHIATGEIFKLDTDETPLHNTVWMDWSPDSQWVLIRTASIASAREGNHYYLARPDGSYIMHWVQHLVNPPIWSADGHFVSFYTASPYLAHTNTVLYVMPTDALSAYTSIIHSVTLTQWSPYGTDMAFVYYSQLAGIRRLGYYNPNHGMRFLTSTQDLITNFTFWR